MGTAADLSPSLASKLLHWFARAWEATTEADVIGRLSDESLSEIARDCSLTPDRLLQVARAGPHASDEVAALMAALDIDAAEVARVHPGEFRDMQINCSACIAKARCRRDLAAQVADRQHLHYCGNAEHLAGMRTDVALLTA